LAFCGCATDKTDPVPSNRQEAILSFVRQKEKDRSSTLNLSNYTLSVRRPFPSP
jgi:hypothetical protein